MPIVSMTVNGQPVTAEVEGRTLLVQLLREHLLLCGEPVSGELASNLMDATAGHGGKKLYRHPVA